MKRHARIPAQAVIALSLLLGATALVAVPAASSDAVVDLRVLRDVEGLKPGPYLFKMLVRGTGRVEARLIDPATGNVARSAPAQLQPWWQSLAVRGPSTGRLEAAVRSLDGDGEVEVRDAALVAAGPTVVTTSQRQLIVGGAPYTIRGYNYLATPIGETPFNQYWNSTPAHCQSDANLMQAAGVNTLRIHYLEESYDAAGYDQCMTAFAGAGIGLLWLIDPAASLQISIGAPGSPENNAYIEAYWLTLSTAINRVKQHPATLGYVIGNEIQRTNSRDQPGYFHAVDELSRRSHQLDPNHVTSLSINGPQFFGFCTQNDAGQCTQPPWPGVQPDTYLNIDIFGLNHYWNPSVGTGVWSGIVARTKDATHNRPVFLSEWGTDRYRCFGYNTVAQTCSVGQGSREDPDGQGSWDAGNWSQMSQHLSADDPTSGAIVGGTLFMWSDLWWFAVGFFANGAPQTHDVAGGQGSGFFHNNFPDHHFSPEWIGTTHAMRQAQQGPRVTTRAYDQVAGSYTGVAGVVVTAGPTLTSLQACQATVAWTTNVPTFSRVDYGLRDRVQMGDAIQSDNFVGDQFKAGSTPSTSHSVTIPLQNNRDYRLYVRGFDPNGRPGGSNLLDFRTPPPPIGTVCG